MEPTRCNLQFTNGSWEGVKGITRDVIVRVEKFRFMVDLVIMHTEEVANTSNFGQSIFSNKWSSN